MAISFDESDDYYSIADATAFTLPDGDWCVGIWCYVDENGGSDYQYALSNDTWRANPSFNLQLTEDSENGSSDHYQALIGDDDTTDALLQSASSPGADSTWRLIIIQRDTNASEIQMWFCERGATAVKEDSTSDAGFAASDGPGWNIGRRADADADRYWGGQLAEFFKGNFALTQAQIEAAAIASILCLNKDLDVYYPLFRADATLKNWCGDNDATRNSVPTTSAHPPLFRPGPPQSP